MDIFSAFSSKENLKQAFLYLKEETGGGHFGSSLPLDPMWRPAISAVKQLGDDFFEALETYLRQDKYHPDKSDYVYNPKDNAGVRPICVFSVVDRIVFQALLNPLILGGAIDGRLFNSCFCNRILGEDKYLKSYPEQWTNFCYAQINAFNNGLAWRFEFDIHTYYENIHIDTLLNTLKEKFQIRDVRLLAILESQLKQWSEKPTMCGLPQGANASDVLANAYLHPFDTFLDDLKGNDRFEYFRYCDDTVIMAESADKINSIIEKAVLFLRTYNLNLNEKSKLEKLGDTKSIEEMIFHNPYGHLNETSRQKLEEISKKIPTILRKLKGGKDVKKTELGNLKYYLRAGAGMGDSAVFDNVVALIPNRPSLIFYISNYFGFYFSNEDKEFYQANKLLVHAKYESIWEMYSNKSLTAWTRFWLLKVLSTPIFAREHEGFQAELDRIVADPNAQFLRPLAFFYKAYMRDMIRVERAMKKESIDSIDAGFTLDDIKRQIRYSKTGAEEAIYYYFVFYLKDTEEEGVIRGLVYDALASESPEVQVMGIFLIKKLYRKSLPEIMKERASKGIVDVPGVVEIEEKDTLRISLEGKALGELSRIYFKLPASEKTSPEQKADELLTDDGKIAQNKLPQFLGMATVKVELVGKAQEDLAAIAANIEKGTIFTERSIITEKSIAKAKSSEVKMVKIKSADLNRKTGQHALVVNGTPMVPFNERNDDETKTFKILSQLWACHYEEGKSQIMSSAHWVAISDILRESRVESPGALETQVRRLNNRFSEFGLAIRIETQKGSCRLVVKFG
jgi:retron-type reverse transcriptase